jgi:hypothetical protein
MAREGEIFPADDAPSSEWEKFTKGKEAEYEKEAHARRGSWTGVRYSDPDDAQYMTQLANNLQRGRRMTMQRKRVEQGATRMEGGQEVKANPDSFSKGGRVKKTGFAKVHKGERVLTRHQARSYKGKK